VGFPARDYLEDMTYRNQPPNSATKTSQLGSTIALDARMANTLTSWVLRATAVVLVLATISMAAELPEAPSSSMRNDGEMIEVAMPVQSPTIVPVSRETKVIDSKFVSLALISTGSTFADSYTTLFARQNWLAGKTGVCNVEAQSAYLYGTHPTAARAYAVASAKSVSSALAAYYLRKHHNRFWSLPLVANSVISLQGVGQNMAACN
jgi:hypothetical protein